MLLSSLAPVSCLLQGQFHLDADVAAPTHAPLLSTAAAKAAESAESTKTAAKASAKTTTEHICKMAENIAEVHAGEVAGFTAHAGVTELVVTGLLVRVAEHIVSLGSLLEFLLSLFVARIAVRVVLHSLLAICLLYLVG